MLTLISHLQANNMSQWFGWSRTETRPACHVTVGFLIRSRRLGPVTQVWAGPADASPSGCALADARTTTRQRTPMRNTLRHAKQRNKTCVTAHLPQVIIRTSHRSLSTHRKINNNSLTLTLRYNIVQYSNQLNIIVFSSSLNFTIILLNASLAPKLKNVDLIGESISIQFIAFV